MSLTKMEMWFSIILVVLVFAFSIQIFGADLIKADTPTLDQRSQDYVTEFSSNINTNNLSSFTNNQSLTEKKSNPLVSAITNLPVIQDVVGGINFIIDKTRQVMNGIAVVYNLPTFFLQGFGLPVAPFNHIINIITATLVLAFTIMLIRETR